MVLKLNIYNSDFSGIQTHDLCLVTGNHYLPKSAILRRRLPNEALNICLTIADRNWLDVSSQFQGPLKELEFVKG